MTEETKNPSQTGAVENPETINNQAELKDQELDMVAGGTLDDKHKQWKAVQQGGVGN